MIDYKPVIHNNFENAIKEFWKMITLLRSENGCPWDKKQTSENILEDLKSELYELSDALEKKDKDEECEELGDVLLGILFLMNIAFEKRGIDPLSVVNNEISKIYTRHPHVFGDKCAQDESDVWAIWREVKKKEGKVEDENDFFSRIPKSMNKYDRAAELHRKVRKVGFDWDNDDGVYAKVEEELNEVKNAALNEGKDALEMECGDLIFASIALCTRLNVNPDIAIHRTNRKFESRFNKVVKLAKERGIPVDREHFHELDSIWDEIKQTEHDNKN